MSPEGLLLAVRVVMALVLLGFLAAILWYLFQDVRSTERRAEEPPPCSLVVSVPGEQPRSYPLGAVNEIGRAADNTLCIADETVSSYHARLSYHSGQWWLEDLGSRNGTRVNTIPVREPLILIFGDQIAFGRIKGQFEAGVDGESDSSDD